MGTRIEEHPENGPKKNARKASGKPGGKPTWASGAKTAVGTAASYRSRIWFTVAKGSLNEVYHPDVDQANTRSVRFLISDGTSYFSDEEENAVHHVTWPTPGVPFCRIECECPHGEYKLVKEVITDPVRDTLLIRTTFTPTRPELKLYLYIEPHVADKGDGNTGWISDYKEQTMLVATRKDICLSATASVPFAQCSVGYIGKTDGLVSLRAFEPLPNAEIAREGAIGLTGQIELPAEARSHEFVVALSCGHNSSEAGLQARAGVLQHFDTTKDLFIQQWQDRQSEYRPMEDLSDCSLDLYRVSTAVLEMHQSKRFPGAFVASLSLPWGFAHGDTDVDGYHVTWPRDLAESAMGKLACGDAQTARSSLFYLTATQNADGGWSQNMWLDGSRHWGAVQMDGCSLPILLADQLRREKSLDGYDPCRMVRKATEFLLKNGPVTQQERWEALPGYSAFTMATQISALLAAADILEADGEAGTEFLRETADAWNAMVEEYTWVEGTALAQKHKVRGYYVRIAPPKRALRDSLNGLFVYMPNRRFGAHHYLAKNIVSPDALALVRFGLRRADDPRILDTVRVIDATLKHETKTGPTWTRSSEDGYGESDAGAPFLKHGRGRGWPLLAGERAHYELQRGNKDGAIELLKTMGRQTSACGMLPEQVWDAPDLPERQLFNGHPTGSGMPLVWAHAEYIKLLRSIYEDKVWDLPPQTTERYAEKNTQATFQIWSPQSPRTSLAPGMDLRLDLHGPATVIWQRGGEAQSFPARDTGFGIFTALLPTGTLAEGADVELTVEHGASADGKKPAHEKLHLKVRPQQYT